jgi:hypothetical protein
VRFRFLSASTESKDALAALGGRWLVHFLPFVICLPVSSYLLVYLSGAIMPGGHLEVLSRWLYSILSSHTTDLRAHSKIYRTSSRRLISDQQDRVDHANTIIQVGYDILRFLVDHPGVFGVR